MSANLYRIILPVKNIEVAVEFYSKIFDQSGERVSPGRHYYDLGGIILACYDPIADGDTYGEWNYHENQFIYFAVDNLERIRSELMKFDVETPGMIESMPWGETLFYSKDPFGTPICFVDSSTVFRGNVNTPLG